MLQQLNDDCLEQIFTHLSLEEQFTVKRLHCPRFDNVIESMWRRKGNAIHISCHTESTKVSAKSQHNYLVNRKAFKHYISIVSDSVHSLTLDDVEQVSCLAKTTLPKVKNLVLSMQNYDFRSSVIFAKMFPALEQLDLTWAAGWGEADGGDLRYTDHDVPRWKLRKCLFALPLSVKLKSVALNEDLLALIIKQLLTRLPCLRRIRAIHSSDQRPQVLLPRMLQLWPQAQRVHTLAFNLAGSSCRENLDAITEFKNVQALHLFGCRVTLERFAIELGRMLTELRLLQRIHYRIDADIKREHGYDEECERSLVYDFINFVAINARRQQQNYRRTEPLELHCYGPDLEQYYDCGDFNLPQMLRLSLYDHRIDTFPCLPRTAFECKAA